MNLDLWQKKFTEKIAHNLQNEVGILVFATFGSISNGKNKYDIWSDIDGLLIVKDESYREFSDSLKWAEELGSIFAYQKNQEDNKQTIRLIFDDFKRLDIVIIKYSSIEDITLPEHGPYWSKIDIIFSRSEEITKLLKKTKKVISPPQFSDQQFQGLVNNFWFVASLAVYKVMRNDLLIAQHLFLDLYKNCLLLGMIIRDKDTGTNIHKTGGVGNEIAKDMHILLQSISQANVLGQIDQCGKEFDKLCSKWTNKYIPRYPKFEKFVLKARTEFSETPARE